MGKGLGIFGSDLSVLGLGPKGFGSLIFTLNKFRVLLHSELAFSHHWAFVAGPNRECLQVCLCFLGFSTLFFFSSFYGFYDLKLSWYDFEKIYPYP